MKRFNDQRGGRVTSLHRMREAYLVRLFLVRRFLFALEADFPVFSFCSTLGHGAALDIRFGLCARRFLFALEADFPVFIFCSTLRHGAPLDIRFSLYAIRFL